MVGEASRFLDKTIPEFRELGEPLFSLRRFYNDGRFFYLSTDTKCLTHYYQQGYHLLGDFHKHIHAESPIKYSLGDHWDKKDKNYWTVIGDGTRNFNNGHVLTVLKASSTHVNVFNLAADSQNDSINNAYLNNLSSIDKYLSHLLIKADAFLNNVIFNPFYAQYQTVNNHCAESNVKKITYREFQCLELLSKGMTMKGIAKILNFSPRTVESHLLHLKDKLGCPYKEDLINFYHKNL